MLAIPFDIEPDDNGTVLITSPTLPEVVSFGEEGSDVLLRARDAIEEAIGARMAKWEDIELPEAAELASAIADRRVVKVSLQATMKLLLFLACKHADVSRAELARRLGVHREQVDRLFRIDHASRIDQIDAAMTAIGQTFDVKVLEAA